MPFNKSAKYYDYIHFTKNYRREARFLSTIAIDWCKTTKSLKQMRLLDLGCGTGNHLLYLKKYFGECFGIEGSAYMLDMARRKGLGVFKGSIDYAKFDNFDVIIAMFHSINYIDRPAILLATFKNVRKGLSEGGVFIFEVLNRDLLKEGNSKNELYFKYKRKSYKKSSWGTWNPESDSLDIIQRIEDEKGMVVSDEDHSMKIYPAKNYEDLLTDAGFKKVKVVSGKFGKDFRRSYLIIARKEL